MANGSISRAPRPSSLADVLDLILDKGLVIDAYVRVSLVGIELLTVDARIVIASVNTYLHFAEAVNRLDLKATETEGIPELLGSSNGSGNGSGDREQGAESSASRRQRSGNQGPGRPARSTPARALGRGGKRDEGNRDDGDNEESGSRGALVGRLAARGRWQD